MTQPRHARLFAVPFRLQDQPTWSVVEAAVEYRRRDQRLEGRRPVLDTLEVIEQLAPTEGCARRCGI